MSATGSFDKSSPPLSRRFSASESTHHKRRMSDVLEHKSHFGPPLTTLYLGLSVSVVEKRTALVALAVHDSIYLVDFALKEIPLADVGRLEHDPIADTVVKQIKTYESENFIKFIGAGLPTTLHNLSPTLCSRLWLDVDVIPIVMRADAGIDTSGFWEEKGVDEQADSMVRKCIMHFGPNQVPLLQVGWKGRVETDASFRAHLTTLHNYKTTCGEPTWNAMMHYAENLRANKIKIAFFSSTPQGGGVALMRHALVRLSRHTGVDLRWYVPKPRAGVFRITKNMHNILQGVAPPGQWVSDDEKATAAEWTVSNAKRYWLSEGGPLRPVEEGGAHLVVVDDPQMPGLIPFIKKLTPDRPVIFRSHIQLRSDLCDTPGTPQADVWHYLWQSIQHADMFVSHPNPDFVPEDIPRNKVAYMPATTDWLDGLNKPLSRWDIGYYGHMYNMKCHEQRMTELAWPARKYIVQVARFDPSKGVPTVIDSYAEFRRLCERDGILDVPQLCICGNGSIDDPDALVVYDKAIEKLENEYPHLIDDCSIMRLEHHDQLLNTLIAKAHVVLQLSIREGFEVKVSEALHAGRPVIATRAGGLPLQVKDGINGFLVEPGDSKAVARHLMRLFADDELHLKMSHQARDGVSDEVGTVGNALSWYFLGTRWSEVAVDRGRHADGQWVNDRAREAAGYPYQEGENRLPREFTLQKKYRWLS